MIASALLLGGCNFRNSAEIKRDLDLWKAPEEPRELAVTDISYNTARLIWKAPANFGFRNGEEFTDRRYEVQYSRNEKFDNASEVFTFYTENTEFLIQGLSTGETYYARVRATNDSDIETYRSSPYRNLSSPMPYFVTRAVPTLTTPESLFISDMKLPSANTASEISVSWAPPLVSGYDPNKEGLIADIASYDLLIVRGLDFNTTVAQDRAEINGILPNQLEEKITGFIKPGEAYSVRVRVTNSSGRSADATLVFSTDNLSLPPSQATALSARTGTTSNRHVALSWTDPLNNGQLADGTPATLASYEIEYSKDSNFQGITTRVETAPMGVTKPHELTALFDSDVVYYFRVRVINSEGQRSLYSSSLSFRTTESSAGPSEVSVSATAQARSLDAVWVAPIDTGRNKDGSPARSITSYTLRYSTTEADVMSDIIITNDEKGSIPTSGTTLRATIPNLKPYTDYYLAVVATNDNNLSSTIATPIYRIKTLSVATAPAAPLSIVALPVPANNDKRHFYRVTLQWDFPAADALGKDDVGADNVGIFEYKVYATKIGNLDPVAATQTKGLAVKEMSFGQGSFTANATTGKISVEIDMLTMYPNTEIADLTEVAARTFSFSVEAISTYNSSADRLASPRATVTYKFPDRISRLYVGVRSNPSSFPNTTGVGVGSFFVSRVGAVAISSETTTPPGTFTVYEVDSSYNRVPNVASTDMTARHNKTGTAGTQLESIVEIDILENNLIEPKLQEFASVQFQAYVTGGAGVDAIVYRLVYLSGLIREGSGQPDRFISKLSQGDNTQPGFYLL